MFFPYLFVWQDSKISQNTRKRDIRNPYCQKLASDNQSVSFQTYVIHVSILKKEIKKEIEFHWQSQYNITFYTLPFEMCAMSVAVRQKVTFTTSAHLLPCTLHISNPPTLLSASLTYHRPPHQHVAERTGCKTDLQQLHDYEFSGSPVKSFNDLLATDFFSNFITPCI